jgi:hypothetical protein
MVFSDDDDCLRRLHRWHPRTTVAESGDRIPKGQLYISRQSVAESMLPCPTAWGPVGLFGKFSAGEILYHYGPLSHQAIYILFLIYKNLSCSSEHCRRSLAWAEAAFASGMRRANPVHFFLCKTEHSWKQQIFLKHLAASGKLAHRFLQ